MDGVHQRVFEASDPQAAARAVFDATSRFHNPSHATEWADPAIDTAYRAVRELVVGGLRVPTRRARRR